MKKIFLHIFLCIGFAAIAQNQPKVTVKADTTKIRIGEQINYEITVEQAETGVIFPELQLDSLGHIEVVESLTIDTLKNRLVKKYKLTSFDSGSYVIPRQSIFIWNQPYFTDSIRIDVATVAVDTLKQKMYPIKAIHKEPYTFDDFKSYLWWILGILALLAIILYFVLRKKKTPEEIIARIPPYQLALQQLKELDKKQLWQHNKIKEFYVELTEIVRNYIERELKVPALESTTDELIESITDFNSSGSLKLPKETVDKLQKLLKEADLVKFAKYKPLINEIELHRTDASIVVDGIKNTIPQISEDQLTEGATAEQLVEVKKTVQKKKWSTKRIVITALIVFVLAFITIMVVLVYKGIDFAKENIIGHQTKELLESDWFTSTYGYPSVTLETPKVLKSQKVEVPAHLKELIDQTASFNYGSLIGNFYISVVTTHFTDQVETYSLDGAVEGALQNITAMGATITSTDKEEILIDGKEALKVKSDYIFNNPITKKDETGRLMIIISGSKEGSLAVSIGYSIDDEAGEKIADRIINSIKLGDEAVE